MVQRLLHPYSGGLTMRLAWFALCVALSVGSTGCSGSSTTPSTTGPSLSVMLKDSPFSDAKALLVTFSEVSAHASGGDFKTLPFTGGRSRTCDLKKLTDPTHVIDTHPPPSRNYMQLRLMVA